MVPQMLVDTDMLSVLIRRPDLVVEKASVYLADHSELTFSILTKYEILRGLKSKRARKQIAAFEARCASSIILPIDNEVIEKASDIYADLKQRGELIDDVDILIAATAIVNGIGVVTNNEKHFARITGLKIDNWIK
jgi:tRNA(fMet)-specific endonuclease VapC